MAGHFIYILLYFILFPTDSLASATDSVAYVRDTVALNPVAVDSIVRELVLLKVRANKETLKDIRNIVDVFRGKIVDISPENVVIEITGSQGKIEAICEMMAQFEIIEIARTGTIAISRGPIPVKEM